MLESNKIQPHYWRWRRASRKRLLPENHFGRSSPVSPPGGPAKRVGQAVWRDCSEKPAREAIKKM